MFVRAVLFEENRARCAMLNGPCSFTCYFLACEPPAALRLRRKATSPTAAAATAIINRPAMSKPFWSPVLGVDVVDFFDVVGAP